jgi:hypothetical protein
MSNYTKSTNFATKDNLSSGDPLKIVKGTEINTEYDNIATAIATKADLASPTFTGTPTLPTGTIAVTQTFGNSSTAISTTAFVQAALAAIYPIGSIYTNATNSTNPGTLLGFGTWTAFGAGRVPVGFNSANALFDTAEETGGSADSVTISHTHTATSTVSDPGHAHQFDYAPYLWTVAGGPSTVDANRSGSGPGTTTTATTGIGVSTSISTAGSSGTNANYQPYITVYMWKRTA